MQEILCCVKTLDVVFSFDVCSMNGKKRKKFLSSNVTNSVLKLLLTSGTKQIGNTPYLLCLQLKMLQFERYWVRVLPASYFFGHINTSKLS